MDPNLYAEAPSDLRKVLHLASNETLKLREAVYGLLNAPKEWFKRLYRDGSIGSSLHWGWNGSFDAGQLSLLPTQNRRVCRARCRGITRGDLIGGGRKHEMMSPRLRAGSR